MAECVFGAQGSGQCEVANIKLTIQITSAAEAARIILSGASSNAHAKEFLLATYGGVFERDIAGNHQSSAALSQSMQDAPSFLTVPGARFTGVRRRRLLQPCICFLTLIWFIDSFCARDAVGRCKYWTADRSTWKHRCIFAPRTLSFTIVIIITIITHLNTSA